MYRIECVLCREQFDIFKKMSEYDDLPFHCGAKTFRVMCAPAVIGDLQPYISPASGKVINSRSAQAEDLKRTNSYLNEPGFDKDVKRWGAEKKEKDFLPIAAGIDSAVSQLVATQKIES